MYSRLSHIYLEKYSPLIPYLAAGLVGTIIGAAYLVEPILAPILVLGTIFLVITLQKPIILCYFTIIVAAVGSGIQRGRIVPQLTLNEIALVASVGISFVYLLVNKRYSIKSSYYGLMAFYSYVGGVFILPVAIYLLQGVRLSINNAFKLASPIQYLLIFILYSLVPRKRDEKRFLIYTMLVGAGIVAFVGLMQAAKISFVVSLLNKWYPSVQIEDAANTNRITSLMGAWNSLGILMMFAIVMCWTLLPAEKSFEGKTFLGLVLGICLLCLLVSGSFAGILCTVTGLGLVTLMNRKKATRIRVLPILMISIILGTILLVVFQPLLQPFIEQRLIYQFRNGNWIPHTLSDRFLLWKEIFIPAIREAFPWAVYPVIPDTFLWGTVESQYLGLLFSTGLAGLLGHLTWIIITLVWVYSYYKKSVGFNHVVAQATFIILILLSIAGLTNSVFGYAGTIDFLWVLLAFISTFEGETEGLTHE